MSTSVSREDIRDIIENWAYGYIDDEDKPILNDYIETNSITHKNLYHGRGEAGIPNVGMILTTANPSSWSPNKRTAELFATIREDDGLVPIVLHIEELKGADVKGLSRLASEEEILTLTNKFKVISVNQYDDYVECEVCGDN